MNSTETMGPAPVDQIDDRAVAGGRQQFGRIT